MSTRDWSDLDRWIDDAIDALNDERPPDLEGDGELQLLDTLRVVRWLREAVEPDTTFEDQLVKRLLTEGEPADLTSYPNGSSRRQPTIGTIERPTARRSRMLLGQIAAVLRVIGVFVLAGMLSGALVGGIGGRVVMRVSGYLYQRENPGVTIVTESSGEPVGQISLVGTIDLILQSMGSGVVIGILLLLVTPWLPRNGWQRAAAFGLFLLAVVGVTVVDADSRDLRILGPPLLNIAMFATLIVAAGMLATSFVPRMNRAVSARQGRVTRLGATILGGVAVVLGSIALFATTLLLVVNGVMVPVHAVVEPGVDTIVVAPLVLVLLIGIPLTRMAVAIPDHLPALDRLRTAAMSRFVSVALMLVTVVGLLVLLVNSIRIASS